MLRLSVLLALVNYGSGCIPTKSPDDLPPPAPVPIATTTAPTVPTVTPPVVVVPPIDCNAVGCTSIYDCNIGYNINDCEPENTLVPPPMVTAMGQTCSYTVKCPPPAAGTGSDYWINDDTAGWIADPAAGAAGTLTITCTAANNWMTPTGAAISGVGCAT